MRRIFDRKISDRTIRGYNAEEIRSWLSDVKEVDSLKYYYYHPGSKFPAESKTFKNQSTSEVLSFLDSRFSESPDFVVEIQQKVYKSGKCEIIFRGISLKGEVTKIAVLELQKSSGA